MKISTSENGNVVQFRSTTAAVESLGLTPFTADTAFTRRGNLVRSTGQGWFWLSRFDDKSEPVLADLLDVEAAELAVPVRKRA